MRVFFYVCFLLFTINLSAQLLEGSWRLIEQNGKPVTDVEYIKIYQDGYFAFGAREAETHHFVSAGGGEFTLNGDSYSETFDFFTVKPEWVGKTFTYQFNTSEDTLHIVATSGGSELREIWKKISDKKDDLTGNWVITGRKRDDEIRTMVPGARRTVKILSGGRFQWIAFNSETKEFMGTGGGTYTAEKGVYSEHIEFFSRDNNRVGATLTFEYSVQNKQWHHSGKSSKGDPIYEIWSAYKEAYKK